MANDNSKQDGGNFFEKPSPLKTAFQWAGAFASALTAEAPQIGFNQAGQTYDYVKTWIGAHKGPKPNGGAA